MKDCRKRGMLRKRLKMYMKRRKNIFYKLKPLRKEPILSDYYHPSEKQKNGEIIFAIAGLGLLGYIMYKMYK